MINVKILKEIINDIPDDVVICFGDDDSKHHIQGVNKAEICSCDFEDHDALVFSYDGNFYSDYSVKNVYLED